MNDITVFKQNKEIKILFHFPDSLTMRAAIY